MKSKTRLKNIPPKEKTIPTKIQKNEQLKENALKNNIKKKQSCQVN